MWILIPDGYFSVNYPETLKKSDEMFKSKTFYCGNDRKIRTRNK